MNYDPNAFNPYQAPTDQPYQQPMYMQQGPQFGYPPLASRGARFGGAMIDSIASMVIALPLQYSMGVFDGFPERTANMPFGEQAMWGVIGFGIWFAIQVYFLRSGQTIGKKLVGTRMVDADSGQVPPVAKLVFLRYLPVSVVSLIPGVGGIAALADALFIFRQDHRCIHDLIANTRVVVAMPMDGPPGQPPMGGPPMGGPPPAGYQGYGGMS